MVSAAMCFARLVALSHKGEPCTWVQPGLRQTRATRLKNEGVEEGGTSGGPVGSEPHPLPPTAAHAPDIPTDHPPVAPRHAAIRRRRGPVLRRRTSQAARCRACPVQTAVGRRDRRVADGPLSAHCTTGCDCAPAQKKPDSLPWHFRTGGRRKGCHCPRPASARRAAHPAATARSAATTGQESILDTVGHLAAPRVRRERLRLPTLRNSDGGPRRRAGCVGDVPSPREPGQTVAPTTSRPGKRTTSCPLTPPFWPYTAWQRRVRLARSCARGAVRQPKSAFGA